MEVMVGVLLLLFLIVPLAELFVIIQVGQAFGALNTIGLLILVSAVGAWLVKREGYTEVRRGSDDRQLAAYMAEGDKLGYLWNQGLLEGASPRSSSR